MDRIDILNYSTTNHVSVEPRALQEWTGAAWWSVSAGVGRDVHGDDAGEVAKCGQMRWGYNEAGSVLNLRAERWL